MDGWVVGEQLREIMFMDLLGESVGRCLSREVS
jgi:hypothetical protein